MKTIEVNCGKMADHDKIGNMGMDILEYIAQGKTRREMAGLTGLNENAVYVAVTKLRNIFQVKNDVSLILAAINNKVIKIELI